MVVDPDLPAVRRRSSASCATRPGPTSWSAPRRYDETEVLAAVEAGAVGYLRKESLTPESLGDRRSRRRQRQRRDGAGDPRDAAARHLPRRRRRRRHRPRLARLSDRERDVLRLVAQGLPTREVAAQLCYSERTIKNVIHDVVTKLNARTRSQAVAHAMRDGLI